MKPIHASMLLMAGLLALINSPASSRAQDKAAAEPSPSTNAAAAPEPAPAQPPPAPAKPPAAAAEPAVAEAPPPAPAPQSSDNTPDNRKKQDRHQRPARHAGEEVAVPFIGVLTTSVSPELRSQFGIPEGFGLQVVEVMPDTPAQAAGIREHDILLNFDDQKLVNMEQLQTLVRSHKKDDQITLTVITGGRQTQLNLKIGERMLPRSYLERQNRDDGRFPHIPRSSWGFDRRDRFDDDYAMDNLEDTLANAKDRLRNFQERVREYEKRLRDWSRNRSDDEPPPRRRSDGRYDSPPNHQPRHDGVISRRDASGEYELRRETDRTIFTVRPKDGEQQSWNIDDKAQLDAIPEQFRAKLQLLEEIRQQMPRHGKGPRKPAADRPQQKDQDRSLDTPVPQGNSPTSPPADDSHKKRGTI